LQTIPQREATLHSDPNQDHKLISPRIQHGPDHPVVLAFGGSAGTVQPLIDIVRVLPDDLSAAVPVTTDWPGTNCPNLDSVDFTPELGNRPTSRRL
jgi:hypothetical protein